MVGVAGLQLIQQIFHFRKTCLGSLLQLVAQLLHAKVILMVEQLEHLDQQFKTITFQLRDIVLTLQVVSPSFLIPAQDVIHGVEPQLLPDAVGQHVLFIDKGPADLNLTQDLIG